MARENRRRWAVAAAGFYFFFLAWTAPAALLDGLLGRASGGALRLGSASGTLWRGGGDLLWNDPIQGALRLSAVRWRVNPLWLLTGRLGLSVEGTAPELTLSGRIRLSPAGMTLRDVKAFLPASRLARFFAPAQVAGLHGDILFSAPALFVGRAGALNGAAELSWRQAASDLSALSPLGDYRLVIEGQRSGAAVRLETVKGDLALSGLGQWRLAPSRAISFNGEARPAGHATELEPLLQWLGPDAGGGKRVLSLNAAL